VVDKSLSVVEEYNVLNGLRQAVFARPVPEHGWRRGSSGEIYERRELDEEQRELGESLATSSESSGRSSDEQRELGDEQR
jgi:hypothetical protein